MKATVTFAGLALAFAAVGGVAHAQPAGDATATRAPIYNTKPQVRAEQKKNARPAGKVQTTGGDTLNTPENGSIGTDKGAARAQSKVAARKQSQPNRKPVAQGGTPDMPGAK